MALNHPLNGNIISKTCILHPHSSLSVWKHLSGPDLITEKVGLIVTLTVALIGDASQNSLCVEIGQTHGSVFPACRKSILKIFSSLGILIGNFVISQWIVHNNNEKCN